MLKYGMRFYFSIFAALAVVALAFAWAAPDACAFGELQGSCESDCNKCHTITGEEASDMLRQISPEIEVIDTRMSPVRGLWEVSVKGRGKRGLAYIDFSKTHVITGSIIEVSSKENLTNKRLYELSKVDISMIPLAGALLMGKPDAPVKIVVFADPDCPYCRNLHRDLRTIISGRDDIAFYIKVLPLKIHPAAYKKAKAIDCEKSIKLLERSYEGKPLPEPACETTEVDETIDLADRLGITSTPTVILPDGGVISEYKPASELLELIKESLDNLARGVAAPGVADAPAVTNSPAIANSPAAR